MYAETFTFHYHWKNYCFWIWLLNAELFKISVISYHRINYGFIGRMDPNMVVKGTKETLRPHENYNDTF